MSSTERFGRDRIRRTAHNPASSIYILHFGLRASDQMHYCPTSQQQNAHQAFRNAEVGVADNRLHGQQRPHSIDRLAFQIYLAHAIRPNRSDEVEEEENNSKDHYITNHNGGNFMISRQRSSSTICSGQISMKSDGSKSADQRESENIDDTDAFYDQVSSSEGPKGFGVSTTSKSGLAKSSIFEAARRVKSMMSRPGHGKNGPRAVQKHTMPSKPSGSPDFMKSRQRRTGDEKVAKTMQMVQRLTSETHRDCEYRYRVNGGVSYSQFCLLATSLHAPAESAACTCVRYDMITRNLAGLFQVFDHDKSGYLDFKELMCYLSTVFRGSVEDRLLLLFLAYDRYRMGVLEREAMEEVAKTVLLTWFKKNLHTHIEESSPSDSAFQYLTKLINHTFPQLGGDIQLPNSLFPAKAEQTSTESISRVETERKEIQEKGDRKGKKKGWAALKKSSKQATKQTTDSDDDKGLETVLGSSNTRKLINIFDVLTGLLRCERVTFSHWRETVLENPVLRSCFDFVPVTSFYFAACASSPSITSSALVGSKSKTGSGNAQNFLNISPSFSPPMASAMSTSRTFHLHESLDRHVDIENLFKAASQADGMKEFQRVSYHVTFALCQKNEGLGFCVCSRLAIN